MTDSTSRIKIAVIEDDQALLSVYKRLLESRAEIHCFARPSLFLQAIHDGLETDLVIADLSLPEMTGVAMIAEARKTNRRFLSLLVSGNVDKESAIAAMDAGVSKIIEKPARKDDLQAAVASLTLLKKLNDIRSESHIAVEQLRELNQGLRLMVDTVFPGAVGGVACNDSETQELSSMADAFADVEQKLDRLMREASDLEEERLRSETLTKHVA